MEDKDRLMCNIGLPRRTYFWIPEL